MHVINFRNIATGTLVTRSAHWNKERCVKKGALKEIGVITDLKFFKDKVAGIVTYPVIHWEGGVMASMTHPVNVALFRKPKAPVEMIAIDPEEN